MTKKKIPTEPIRPIWAIEFCARTCWRRIRNLQSFIFFFQNVTSIDYCRWYISSVCFNVMHPYCSIAASYVANHHYSVSIAALLTLASYMWLLVFFCLPCINTSGTYGCPTDCMMRLRPVPLLALICIFTRRVLLIAAAGNFRRRKYRRTCTEKKKKKGKKERDGKRMMVGGEGEE